MNLQISQYTRSLIEASRDPMFTINTNGKITDVNNASVIVTHVPRNLLVGTDFFAYFTEPRKARQIYKQVFKEGFVIDFPLTMQDGKLTDVLFNGSVYKDDFGKVMGVVVVARDITEYKRIAKELTEAKVHAEVATGVAEAEKCKAERNTVIAENAVRSKQQFLSNMSHEIRTPMNAILGFTKVLMNTDISDKQKEYLMAIKTSGDALTVLINDILDLAKVDAGKMTFQATPFKLAVSISAMLAVFETKVQEKNLRMVKKYDRNIPNVLIGDPIRLHQIILNLLSNAIKFTTVGEIEMMVQVIEDEGETVLVEFAVSDTGIGISKAELVNIFDNFQQASNETTRLYGGTGLGLAIAKQLVESQGGHINVRSKVGIGSSFSFVLPFQKTANDTDAEQEPFELDELVKNIRVLVVEDILLNQLLMKTLLDDFGFEHEIASNGLKAVEILKTKTFDVILMDLQMPEMNGFQATDYILKKLKLKIPIIALTADVTTADLDKCRAVGMTDYISKPIDDKILYYKIIEAHKKYLHDQGILFQNKAKLVNLSDLNKRVKSKPNVMMDLIALYLEQTPVILNEMNKSLNDKNCLLLSAATHKLIPSFSIMGMDKKYEEMARFVQAKACDQNHQMHVQKNVSELVAACTQACVELKEEYLNIKNSLT